MINGGRAHNNQVENSHLPFRRRERAMLTHPTEASVRLAERLGAEIGTGVEEGKRRIRPGKVEARQ